MEVKLQQIFLKSIYKIICRPPVIRHIREKPGVLSEFRRDRASA